MYYPSIHIIRIVSALVLCTLSSCGWLGKPQGVDVSESGNFLPVPTATVPPVAAPATTAQESVWVFTVVSEQTTGKIDLSLDPKGSLLGAKPAQDSAPLSGKIVAILTTKTDGTRDIRFKNATLTNTVKLMMPFRWSRLVGNIAVNIPSKVLKITNHSFPNQCAIEKDGTFSIPGKTKNHKHLP